MICIQLFVIIVFLCVYSNCLLDSAEIQRKQDLLSELVNIVLNSYNVSITSLKDLQPISEKSSSIIDICKRSLLDLDLRRFCCCITNDQKHVYNAMINDNGLVLFKGHDSSNKNYHSESLPPIVSMRLQQRFNFNMNIKETNDEFPSSQCKKIFNGTLHITGRGTIKNVYHALSDNFLPVVSQVLVDAVLSPEFLHLPRAQLVGFHPHDHSAVPHIKLIDHLMTAGTLSLQEANGMCFRRIIWGQGPHMMYQDVLVFLRRMVTDFTRLLITRVLNIPNPKVFQPTIPENSAFPTNNSLKLNSNIPILTLPNGTVIQNNNLNGMKIVLYTRGDSGKGRSMKGESKLIDLLNQNGAIAIICCDFDKTTLEEQIGYAYHADAIVGLHGAALAHGIFSRHGYYSLELKTLYGYTSILFGIISDSRQGYHSQIDVRDYFIAGGHKPIDDPLINKVLETLNEVANFHHRHDLLPIHQPDSESIKFMSKPGDFIMNHAIIPSELNHILGPKANQAKNVCSTLIFTQVRKQLGSSEDDLHCSQCQNPNIRLR